MVYHPAWRTLQWIMQQDDRKPGLRAHWMKLISWVMLMSWAHLVVTLKARLRPVSGSLMVT